MEKLDPKNLPRNSGKIIFCCVAGGVLEDMLFFFFFVLHGFMEKYGTEDWML